MTLFRSHVARKIAIKFVVSFVGSGGNLGIAIHSVAPDILRSLGLNPNLLLTPSWNPNLPHPLSSGGVGSLSRYIIQDFLAGPLTRAFCNDIAPIIDAIRPIANGLWKRTQYGTPNAWEYSARITYQNGIGWYANDVKRGMANMRQYGTRGRDGTPRGTYARPQDTFYDVFDIHTHVFDDGQQFVIQGNHPNAGQVVMAIRSNYPSPGRGGDMDRLDPKLIGLIVTNTSIVVYSKIGRRCRFNR